MERAGLQHPEDEIDLFCLHYLAIPLLTSTLQEFVTSWNNHSLRTERERSPLQLFAASLQNLREYADVTGTQFTELQQVFFICSF